MASTRGAPGLRAHALRRASRVGQSPTRAGSSLHEQNGIPQRDASWGRAPLEPDDCLNRRADSFLAMSATQPSVRRTWALGPPRRRLPQAVDNRARAAGETSRKRREPLDLQPEREFFRETVASQVIILTILSIILGAGLGLRLTYPLLVPVVTAAMAIVTLIGFAQGQETWWFVVGAIVVATGLQFGYLAGALALVVAPPEPRFRVAALRATVPQSIAKK
jgi:hypothetical protein